MDYKVNFRTVWATQRNPVIKQRKKKERRKEKKRKRKVDFITFIRNGRELKNEYILEKKKHQEALVFY